MSVKTNTIFQEKKFFQAKVSWDSKAILFLVPPLDSHVTLDELFYFWGGCVLSFLIKTWERLLSCKYCVFKGSVKFRNGLWLSDGVAHVVVWILVKKSHSSKRLWNPVRFLLLLFGWFLYTFQVVEGSVRIIDKLKKIFFPGHATLLKANCQALKVIAESDLPCISLPEVVLMFLPFYFCSPWRPLKLENSFNSSSPAGSVLEFCSSSKIFKATACLFLDMLFCAFSEFSTWFDISFLHFPFLYSNILFLTIAASIKSPLCL